ncbi:MAG: hypothetical protein HN830_10120 [Candidatus Marinimicrobia bacterium]|nr:hypothetical protein [Candidatus Neomarinimicrobiota bacterium]MBT7278929.1 hypothetical protein [Candidatus Neomarinimicrobiota bacterium]
MYAEPAIRKNPSGRRYLRKKGSVKITLFACCSISSIVFGDTRSNKPNMADNTPIAKIKIMVLYWLFID